MITSNMEIFKGCEGKVCICFTRQVIGMCAADPSVVTAFVCCMSDYCY